MHYWQNVYEKYPVQELISLELEEFGTHNGLTFGVADFNFLNGAVFSFAGRHIKNDDRTRAIIQNTVPYLAVALMRIAEAEKEITAFNPKMTNREVEVLRST